MKIILLQNVDRLGNKGDVVEVKPGYARNYLIPRGYAFLYTTANIKKLEELNRIKAVREEKKKRELVKLKDRLNELSLTLAVQAGEDGKLFGAVTNIDVAELLAKEGYNIDKRDILLDEPIKELGVYTIDVILHPEVKAQVKLWVVSK